MKIREELIDEMFEQHKPGEDLFGPNGVVSELTKRLMERILEGEMAAHLGDERGERSSPPRENTRYGTSSKRIKTDRGELQLDVPRDRKGELDLESMTMDLVAISRTDRGAIAELSQSYRGAIADRPRTDRGLIAARPDTPPHEPQHLLYFRPLPQGHRALRPTFLLGGSSPVSASFRAPAAASLRQASASQPLSSPFSSTR